jgi:hypothetical protein
LKGPATAPFVFGGAAAIIAFVVEAGISGYITGMISGARRIILADHARLPWRFFGRLTAVQAGL